jgi:hypothetical protein
VVAEEPPDPQLQPQHNARADQQPVGHSGNERVRSAGGRGGNRHLG